MQRYIGALALLLLIPNFASSQTAGRLSWSANGQAFRGRENEMVLECPAGNVFGPVWGTNPFTDDSSICTAAVYAGLISTSDGGKFVLQAGKGANQFKGGRRNGVTAQSYGQWDGSFFLSEYVDPTPPPEPGAPAPAPATTAMPATISWLRSAKGLGPTGRQFTFVCGVPAQASPVIGDSLYSSESSICNAAVHAGVITRRAGGRVTIQMKPGSDEYRAASRNTVQSAAGQRSLLGFIFIKAQRR